MTVEFAINDKADVPLNSPQRKAYEQLIRRLLALPGQPAVVLLHHYAWWMSTGDGRKGGLFYREPEGQHTAMAHYYDLPSVSVRAATWRLMQAGVEGFKVRAPGCGPEAAWTCRQQSLAGRSALQSIARAPAGGWFPHRRARCLLVPPAGGQDGTAWQREPADWQTVRAGKQGRAAVVLLRRHVRRGRCKLWAAVPCA